MATNTKKILQAWLFFIFGAFCILGFFVSAPFYNGYKIPYGEGVSTISSSELVYYLWYAVYGLGAVAGFCGGLYLTRFSEWIESFFRSVISRPQVMLGFLAGFVFVGVISFRFLVLLNAPIADDESTYRFIAQTLLTGNLVNPIPEDAVFYKMQFVVMNKMGWFGKYPIGHPLLLAAGEWLQVPWLPGAVFTSLSLIITFFIGQKLFGNVASSIGVCLLALSPHFVATGATLLSQTSSTLFMLLGFWAFLCLREKKRLIWALWAGVFFGLGVLIRPMPGLFFVAAAAAVFVLDRQGLSFGNHFKENFRFLGLAAVPVFLVGVVWLYINYKQSGSIFVTGIQEAGGLGISNDRLAPIFLSLTGAFVRENFWLFGWPCSFLFVWFIRSKKSLALFWAIIAAELAYRVIAPKTVVATTGPIYVTEIVPLLALATGSGMIEVKRAFDKMGSALVKKAVISVVAASMIVAMLCFWPVQIKNISQNQQVWNNPSKILAYNGIKRALVFAPHFVPPESYASWAYYPPIPSPSLKDEIIFVKPMFDEKGSVEPMLIFWKKHYSDRPAYVLGFDKGKAVFYQLN